MSWVGRFSGALTGLFVPASCAACGGGLRRGGDDRLCHSCTGVIERVPEPWCATCGVPFDAPTSAAQPHCEDCRGGRAFTEARSFGLFDGLLRELITRLKYSGEKGLAEPLGNLLRDAAQEHLTLQDYEAIVPVPLHRDRLRQRGFNQAFLLARPLAAQARIPIVNALHRTVKTKAQVGLQGESRRSNVRGVFALQPRARDRVSRRNVLLIDDVITTGATVDECARALRGAGASRIDVMSVARTR
jgi:ComF family protein